MRSIYHVPPLLFLLLCHLLGTGHACMIDPLAPIGWIKSGVTTAYTGVKTAVTGTADVVQGAYRLAKPTQPSGIHATPSEPPKSGFKPIGCYADRANKRDLPFVGGHHRGGRHMNKAKCSTQCQLYNVKYFGLQSNPDHKDMLDCWCGHNYGKYGAGTTYDCQNRCPNEEGQTEELCGGENYNSVYEMKYD